MKLYDIIRAAGDGEIVGSLAKEAGIGRDQAEQVLRTLLPELGRAVRRTGEGRTGAPVVRAALHDERYARYLEQPPALREPVAAQDGERVLEEVMGHEQRDEVVRGAAAVTNVDEASLRRLLPLVATLAMAALGQQLREQSPEIPWFGTRPGDQFGAPLLNALAAMFGHEDEAPPERR